MPKMSINTKRLHLEGPTMGTRWSVLLDGPEPPERSALQTALQLAVHEVDTQMSTWNPGSDLMRFNAASLDEWVVLPGHLMQVLAAGLAISQATGGAFEMNVGDAVSAWGFGTAPINLEAVRSASHRKRVRAYEAVNLDMAGSRARKTAVLALDLSGIAKGYGVDRLAEALAASGVTNALCAIDGEVRALGTQADGRPWAVAIEAPDSTVRHAHSMVSLADGAVATSGDYRHFVTVKGHRLSHTIDPRRGSPVVDAPASVSVLAQSCMKADAMATALMVMGQKAGRAFADENGISALFISRDGNGLNALGCGDFA